MQQVAKGVNRIVANTFNGIMLSYEYEIVPCDMSVDKEKFDSLKDLTKSNCSNIKIYENYTTRGISACEGQGLSYRSFIKDHEPMVERSLYVSSDEEGKRCFVSTRFLSPDCSLIVVNAIAERNSNGLKELVAYVYNSDDVKEHFSKNPESNLCEIGSPAIKGLCPPRTIILLASGARISEAMVNEHLNGHKTLSELLILFASSKTDGKIPFEFLMNAEVLTSMFDIEKRKKLF